jgi:hypothetical protein
MSWMVFQGGRKQMVSDCPAGYTPNWHCGDLDDCSTAQTNADGSLTYGDGASRQENNVLVRIHAGLLTLRI